MEINYLNEHLIWGDLGRIAIIISFIASAAAAVSYWWAPKGKAESEKLKLFGRYAFRAHSIAVVATIAILFYIIGNHYFEYYYVWRHSAEGMDMKYIFSCFWEGQEGSFLLWIFWNMILGNILLKIARDWERSTMITVSLIQLFLTSMVLGVFIFGYKLGSNPFILLRHHHEMMNLPFVSNPNYVNLIDGRGLNPLLQNYWMVIHPPTLFLGFAAAGIPFAYAIAGLIERRYTEWVKPALPWTFFGIIVLGTGVLMGGAWAYEALSFGGFWAWDPVENASLVPWITFVAAGHVLLINRNKGHSILAGFLLISVTFILILYSTFLTRSGILGETSVHAFTDLGMSGQLLVYILFFIVFTVVLLVINWRKLPRSKEEESIWSREFWMFVGALVLMVSAFQITFTTSIPVINKMVAPLEGFFSFLYRLSDLDVFQKLSQGNLAPPIDVLAHYNAWQTPFAVIVSLLVAVSQFLRYRSTNISQVARKLLWPFLIAILASGLFAWYLDLKWQHIPLFAASIFAITCNATYFINVFKGKVAKAGASIAHIGFGLIILGIVISTTKSEIISQNTSNVSVSQFGESFTNKENILMMKGDTLRMAEYYVSYRGFEQKGVNIFYQVDYLTKDKEVYQKQFSLKPVIQTNPQMGNVAEPDTRHFLTSDIYTHVTFADLSHLEKSKAQQEKPHDYQLKIGDTIITDRHFIILQNLENIMEGESRMEDGDIAVKAALRILNASGEAFFAYPVFLVRNNFIESEFTQLENAGMSIAFTNIDPDSNEITLLVKEEKKKDDFIIMKAIVFPFINILWLGCLIMIIGTVIAVIERFRVKNLNQLSEVND